MRTILVVNPKGGCGKTTIATNLAGYYTMKDVATELVDLDQQRSAYQWVMSRPRTSKKIAVATELKDSFEARRVILDCPAAIDLDLTATLINLSDVIIMPINPSVIDQRAAFKFIFDIRSLVREHVCKPIKIGLVSNRSNASFNSHSELQKFAKMMQTPVITSLRNSQNYVTAAARGLSLFEMPNHKVAIDKEQWQPLSYWAEGRLLLKRPTLQPKQTQTHLGA